MIQIAAALFGIGLILFGLSHILWLSMTMLLFVGFGMMQSAAAANTVIQTLVPEDKRSRVMSYYTMAFVGMAPFAASSPEASPTTSAHPTPSCSPAPPASQAPLWYTLELPKIRKVMRPIYQQLGILTTPDPPLPS